MIYRLKRYLYRKFGIKFQRGFMIVNVKGSKNPVFLKSRG